MRNPCRYFNSSPEVIRLAVMLYIRFRCARSKTFCSNVASTFVMRRCGTGGTALVLCLQPRSGNAAFIMEPIRTGAGILMRCLSRVNGEIHYLWRAVDHEGEVLEVFATKQRDRKAALRFLKRAMKRYGRPKVIVTDRLKSYRAAMNVIGNAAAQTCGQWLNNRAENSHPPFRRRAGAMARFRDIKTLQKFAAAHASIHNHFNQERHLYNRETFKLNRSAALAEWRQLAV